MIGRREEERKGMKDEWKGGKEERKRMVDGKDVRKER